MAKGRIVKIAFGPKKTVSGIIQREKGGEISFDAPAAMVEKLSVGTEVDFEPIGGRDKWEEPRAKIKKIIE